MSPPSPLISSLSLHDALPISYFVPWGGGLHAVQESPEHCTCEPTPFQACGGCDRAFRDREKRSEEHTSELQSHHDLVCRLLLEKKKTIRQYGLISVSIASQRQ